MSRNILVAFLFVAGMLAGCIGGDDPGPTGDGDNGGTSAEGFGTVRGTIVTVNLDPVEDARVQIVQDAELVAEGTTEGDGTYRITNVEPGEYRLQVTAPCCREFARGISVVADETVEASVQLEVFSSDDLQQQYSESFEWTGFLSCTVRWPTGGVLPYSGISACSLYDPTGQDDFLHEFEVREGIRSIVGAMSWRAPGAALGSELALLMEVYDKWNEPPRYVNADDSSPIEFRVDAGYVLEEYEDNEDVHHYDFYNIEGTQKLAYRIFAGGQVNVVYQQQFTVYWDVYYWEEAPEDASALPDA